MRQKLNTLHGPDDERNNVSRRAKFRAEQPRGGAWGRWALGSEPKRTRTKRSFGKIFGSCRIFSCPPHTLKCSLSSSPYPFDLAFFSLRFHGGSRTSTRA